MFGSGVSSLEIYNDLLTKSIAVASRLELGDSSIKSIMDFEFDTASCTTSSGKNYIFNGACKVGDGPLLTIPPQPTTRYGILDAFNIFTNMKLSGCNTPDFHRSNVRFGNNNDSLFVYVNGYKIPDSEVLLYVGKSGTNIILSKSLPVFKNNNSTTKFDIIVERRQFTDNTYAGVYVKGNTSSFIEFGYGSHRNISSEKMSVIAFVDGVYIGNIISTVSSSNWVYRVNFNKLISGNVEIFIDRSIKYSSTRSIDAPLDKIPFSIGRYNNSNSDELEFMDPLYGPISVDNCMFFKNGLRIENSSITQVGRVDYHCLNESISSGDTYSIIFTDNDIISTENVKIYNEDYYIYNMIGVRGVTSLLMNDTNNSNLEEYITRYNNLVKDTQPLSIVDPVGIMNNAVEGEGFDYADFMLFLKELYNVPDVNQRIQMILNKCRYLISDFMDYFAAEEVRKTACYDGIADHVTIGHSIAHESGTKVIRIIDVNGKIASIEEFIVHDNMRYHSTNVDKQWFKVGCDNDVVIIESSSVYYKSSYKIVPVQRLEGSEFIDNFGNNNVYMAVLDTFGSIHSIDDFKVIALVKREFDPTGIYIDDSEYGFRIIPGSEAPRLIGGDGKIYINFEKKFFKDDPRLDMVIVTSLKHHKLLQVKVKDFNDTYESLFQGLYAGIESFYYNDEYHDVKVPLIHTGAFSVSVEGEGYRLFEGVDYMIKHQLNTSAIRGSCIIFKRELEADSIINIAIMPEYTSSFEYPSMNIEDTGPNKYGLLYLSKMKFPYSSRYTRVYANNKSINPKYINRLSDKLIRLYDEEVSLQNVFVEFSLRASFTQLAPFIEFYNESNFEKFIKHSFSNYDIDFKGMVNGLGRLESDVLYESFDKYVDSNYKTPNKIRSFEYISPRYNLYLDAYLRYFISDRCNHQWKSYEDIPLNILNELEIFLDIGQTNRDVILRPWLNSIINNIELSTKRETYGGFDYGETVKNFLECCVENELSIQDGFERYEEFKHSNRIFKRDLLPIRADVTFEGDDIIVGRGPTFKATGD